MAEGSSGLYNRFQLPKTRRLTLDPKQEASCCKDTPTKDSGGSGARSSRAHPQNCGACPRRVEEVFELPGRGRATERGPPSRGDHGYNHADVDRIRCVYI